MQSAPCPEGHTNGAVAHCDLRVEWPRYRQELADSQEAFELRVARAIFGQKETLEENTRAVQALSDNTAEMTSTFDRMCTRVDTLAGLIRDQHDKQVSADKAIQARVSVVETDLSSVRSVQFENGLHWSADETTEVTARRVESFRDLRTEKEKAEALAQDEKRKTLRNKRIFMLVIGLIGIVEAYFRAKGH